MGSCCQKSTRSGWEEEISEEKVGRKKDHLSLARETKGKKLDLYKDDLFVQFVAKELNKMSPTHKQLIEITNRLKNITIEISAEKVSEEKSIADTLLKKVTRDYNSLVKNLESNESQNRIKSRILHGIGNKVTEDPQFKDMRLKKLLPEQIDELIRYQHIELETEKFMEAFLLKLYEVKESTKKMTALFNSCFSNYRKILENQQFFTLKNGIEAAKFSRGGCNYDNRAIFIFLNYVARTIKRMEKGSEPFGLIEELVKALIESLSKMYPPGQDLVGGNENLRKTLKQIEIVWDKEKEPLQINPLIVFEDHTDKRKKLIQQIKQRARIAGQELPYLNEILRENCLRKCIGVDSNLKLYAQINNQKALVRIIEKMLFKGQPQKQQSKSSQTSSKTQNAQEKVQIEEKYQQEIKEILNNKKGFKNVKLKDQLKEEQDKYEGEVENKLKEKKSLEFTISDMVRGKCTFSKIEDIIETIESIKAYVKKFEKTDPKKYRILEIESRFTKSIPISDITLKIALHERIIAELQLTLQSNVATYAFAHKIYQFQRSKAFSKVKTVFNYYEEYKQDFQELVLGQIRILKNQTDQQSQLIQRISPDVIKHFDISGKQEVTLIDVLNESHHQSKLLDQESKVIVQAVFDRTMGKNNNERAPLFLKHLKEGSSQPFRSVLCYQLIKNLDLNQRVNEICEPYRYFYKYLNEQFLESNMDWRVDGNYLYTIRTQMRFLQLTLLFDISSKDWHQYQPQLNSLDRKMEILYGRNEEMCEWMMSKAKMYDYTSNYQKAIEQLDKAIEILSEKGDAKEICRRKATVLIKKGSFEEAHNILSKLKHQYKLAKQYKNATICAILASECSLNSRKGQEFHEQYNEAREIAKMHQINFGGAEIADSEYRIGQKLMGNSQRQKDALDVHFRCAFQQYGEFMYPNKLLKKMKATWPLYKEKEISQPILKPNLNIREVDLSSQDIDAEDCQYLRKVHWPLLLKINLWNNRIGIEGCYHLSQTNWPNLQWIDLYDNNIQGEGCKHLCKAKWPNLQELFLYTNKIGVEGCEHLCKAEWPNLLKINITHNDIPSDSLWKCRQILQAAFSEAKQIKL